MKKKVNIEYYVFNITHDCKIYRSNIFNKEVIDKIYKEVKNKKITTFKELRDYLHTNFASVYWSRSEYEYMISGMFENMTNVMIREKRDYSVGMKMDVFYQIEKNLNIITELVIHRMELPIVIPKEYPFDDKFWEKGNVIKESLNF